MTDNTTHRIVVATPNLPRAGEAVGVLQEAGVPEERVQVFHNQLPEGIAADQAPEYFQGMISPWRWAGRGGLLGLPLGAALWGLGLHWLWLFGVMAIGAVWGWFARFYLDLFQGEATAELSEAGIPSEEAPFWQTGITDGGVVLVARTTATEVPDALDALDEAGFTNRKLFMP